MAELVKEAVAAAAAAEPAAPAADGSVMAEAAAPEKKEEAPAADAGAKPDGAEGDAGNVMAEAAAEAGAAGAGEKKAEEPAGEKKADEPATPEEVEAFAGKIMPVDLGTGPDGQPLAWDAEAVKAVAPVLLKHKVSPEAGNEIAAAYAAHRREQYKAEAQQEAQIRRAMKEECAAVFGADLKRTAAEAYRGGVSVFGQEFFNELVRVPAFGNDVRVIRALAAVGRAVTDDRAAGAAKGAGAPAESDLVTRLYPPGSLGKK